MCCLCQKLCCRWVPCRALRDPILTVPPGLPLRRSRGLWKAGLCSLPRPWSFLLPLCKVVAQPPLQAAGGEAGHRLSLRSAALCPQGLLPVPEIDLPGPAQGPVGGAGFGSLLPGSCHGDHPAFPINPWRRVRGGAEGCGRIGPAQTALPLLS